MLDLVGRIPTPAEAKAYRGAIEDADKRAQLVDRLLASPAFVRQQAAEFDALLMDGTRQSDLRDYLSKAFRENRRWDQMFREMVVGEPDDAKQKGAIRFVAARVKDQDKLTNDTSVAVLRRQRELRQVPRPSARADWKQDHYYGMMSFFSRTFDVGEFLGERRVWPGQVTRRSEGESRDAKLMFLTGAVIDEPASQEPDEKAKKEEKKQIEELKKNKEPPPPPSLQPPGAARRGGPEGRAEHVLRAGDREPLWNRLLGRGLVIRSIRCTPRIRPSHPELLAWLARDMQAHGYDLRRLIRGIVLSQAYARTSRWDSADKRPADDLFAVAQVRPLKPWQYGTLLKLATRQSRSSSRPTCRRKSSSSGCKRIEGGGRGLGKSVRAAGRRFPGRRR